MENFPTITDWIQAGCAFFGLVGLGFTVWKLFAKDKNREIEIQHLLKEEELQKENNQLLKNFLLSLSDYIIKSESGKPNTNDLKELEEKRYEMRKNDIKPFFTFKSATWSGGEVTINLRNIGLEAKDLHFEPPNDSNPDMFVNIDFKKIIYLQNDVLTFKVRPRLKELLNSSTHLIFSDKDNNYYHQVVALDFMKRKMSFTEPVEMKDTKS